MWSDQISNFSLIQAITNNDPVAAHAALAAGATAMLLMPRCQVSLLQQAVRLHSVRLVDVLLRHGAPATPLEVDQLVKEVRQATQSPNPTVARHVRAIAAALHKHGADFSTHIHDLVALQPTWFQGIHAQCVPASPVPQKAKVTPRARPTPA